MRKRFLLQIFLIAFRCSATRTTAATTKAHYYGHAMVVDARGVIAPWYKGLTGQCALRVRIAAETLKP